MNPQATTNPYTALRVRHAEEIGTLKTFFAFSDAQLFEGMKKIGITNSNEFVSIGNGAYSPRVEVPSIKAMFARHDAEHSASLANDEFLRATLVYELANHEFCITGDHDDAINAVGVTLDDERVKRIFNESRAEYLRTCEDWQDAE